MFPSNETDMTTLIMTWKNKYMHMCDCLLDRITCLFYEFWSRVKKELVLFIANFPIQTRTTVIISLKWFDDDSFLCGHCIVNKEKNGFRCWWKNRLTHVFPRCSSKSKCIKVFFAIFVFVEYPFIEFASSETSRWIFQWIK